MILEVGASCFTALSFTESRMIQPELKTLAYDLLVICRLISDAGKFREPAVPAVLFYFLRQGVILKIYCRIDISVMIGSAVWTYPIAYFQIFNLRILLSANVAEL